MKKLTLSVAALLIAMMTYGQDTITMIEELKEQNWKITSIVDAIRMDMYYGHTEKTRGMYYVNQIIAIKIENEINIAILTKLKEL